MYIVVRQVGLTLGVENVVGGVFVRKRGARGRGGGADSMDGEYPRARTQTRYSLAYLSTQKQTNIKNAPPVFYNSWRN